MYVIGVVTTVGRAQGLGSGEAKTLVRENKRGVTDKELGRIR